MHTKGHANALTDGVEKVLILTDNNFLKIGLEVLFKDSQCYPTEQTVLFDAGGDMYLLQLEESSRQKLPDFFYLITRGLRLEKKDFGCHQNFIPSLENTKNNLKKYYEKPREELSENEESTIKALCAGYSPLEVAKLTNRSVKTVSINKRGALRKLGMSNMLVLYRTMARWELLMKKNNPMRPMSRHSRDYNFYSVGMSFYLQQDLWLKLP